MRKLILPISLAALAGVAIGAILASRPVVDALARAEGYSAQMLPDQPGRKTAAPTAEQRR
jgi:hypothetical protein